TRKEDDRCCYTAGKPRLACGRRRCSSEMRDQQKLVAVAPTIAKAAVREHEQRIALAQLHRTELGANALAGAMDREHGCLEPRPEPRVLQGLAYEARGAADDDLEERVLRAVEAVGVLLLCGHEAANHVKVADHVHAPHECQPITTAQDQRGLRRCDDLPRALDLRE